MPRSLCINKIYHSGHWAPLHWHKSCLGSEFQPSWSCKGSQKPCKYLDWVAKPWLIHRPLSYDGPLHPDPLFTQGSGHFPTVLASTWLLIWFKLRVNQILLGKYTFPPNRISVSPHMNTFLLRKPPDGFPALYLYLFSHAPAIRHGWPPRTIPKM